jgi:hypothetical protein
MADGRRNRKLQKRLIRIPRILNRETARITSNSESLCENLSGKGPGDSGKLRLEFSFCSSSKALAVDAIRAVSPFESA